MPPGRLLVLAALAGFVAGLSPAEAVAHDLRLVVKLPPDSPGELLFEAGFDDDTPAEAARATVTTPDGRLVAEGKTDERGVCRLPRPGPGRYIAVVEALGHRDTVEFEVVGVPGPVVETFAGPRLDKTLGLALGVGGLLLVSLGYARLRSRRRES